MCSALLKSLSHLVFLLLLHFRSGIGPKLNILSFASAVMYRTKCWIFIEPSTDDPSQYHIYCLVTLLPGFHFMNIFPLIARGFFHLILQRRLAEQKCTCNCHCAKLWLIIFFIFSQQCDISIIHLNEMKMKRKNIRVENFFSSRFGTIVDNFHLSFILWKIINFLWLFFRISFLVARGK